MFFLNVCFVGVLCLVVIFLALFGVFGLQHVELHDAKRFGWLSLQPLKQSDSLGCLPNT